MKSQAHALKFNSQEVHQTSDGKTLTTPLTRPLFVKNLFPWNVHFYIDNKSLNSPYDADVLE